MAEKQKESSLYGKLKEKEALLANMDTGKDLLTSSKSMAEDAQMDFDFSAVAKGKNKPFKSDNMDMDSSLGKIAKETNANQDVEPSPSLSGILGFGTCIGASEVDTTSKFDSQLGGEPNSLSKEKSHTSLTDVHLPTKSEIAKYQATRRTQETDQDKWQSDRTTQQEPYEEICQNSSLQSVSENSSTHQTARNSTVEVGCFARKESISTDGERSISGEKTDFGFNCGNLHLDKLPVDIACSQSNDGEYSQFLGDNPVGIDNNDDAEPTQSGIQFEQTSTTTASKKMLHEIETDGETMYVTSELVVKPSNTIETIIETTCDKELPGSKRVTNVIRSKYIKGSDEAKLQLQQSLVSPIKAATFDSKRIKTFQLSPADEGATMGDKAMQIIESLPIIRSESFEGLDETGSQLQQASSSQVKVGTISSQKIRKPDKKYAQTGSKLGALPRPSALPKEQTSANSVEIKSQNSSSNLISKRTRLQDMEVAKGGPVPDGSGSEDLNKFRNLDSEVAETGRESVVLPKANLGEQIEGCSVQIRSQGSPKDLTVNGSVYLSSLEPTTVAEERERRENELEYFRERVRLEFMNIDPKDFFLRRFLEALETNTADSIKRIVGVCDGILIFKMLLRDPCRLIAAKVERFETWCAENDFHPIPPSRIYEYGVVVDQFGLDWMISQLVEKYLQPIINDLNYKDDSDITVKLCVSGADCTGADLQFGETRCLSHETATEPPLTTILLEMGQVVMHCGRHRNGVLPIEESNEDSPKRYIVIWMKSSAFAELNACKSEHPEWCIICRKLKDDRAEGGSGGSSSKKPRRTRVKDKSSTSDAATQHDSL